VRLLTKLRKLEAERAAALAEADRVARSHVPSGVMWTERGPSIDVATLRDGDELVVDYTILSVGEGFTIATCAERVTRDPADLGKVFDAGGRLIGRMLESDPGCSRYELFAEAAASQGADGSV